MQGAGERAKDVTIRCSGGLRPWITWPWIALAPLASLALLAACGPAAAEGEATGLSTAAIYGGVPDNAGNQNPAVVALKIGDGGATFLLCSGALIAPNVVLTARHCVSAQTSTTVSCDQNGVSSSPPDFAADIAPATIHVFTGAAPALLGAPVASAKAIFHPAGATLCNLDLALVVLDAPVTGITPLPVRLTGPVSGGEVVRAVGYGQNDQNAPVGTRFRKDGVAVLAVGSTVSSSQTPLGSSEFEVGESMCEGDSGGPAIDETTGAVVGIVSRGGACTETTGHIYTAVGGFTSVFQQAFALAGGGPTGEGTASAPGEADAGQPPAADAGAMVDPAPSGTTGGARAGGYAPGDLRAGEGKGCSLGASRAESSGLPGTALLGALLLSLAWARSRAGAALCSKDGRRICPPVR